jgi:hypothetical protein
MIRKKVYIAGPMSGLPDCNRHAFNLAAQVQKSLTHIVLNPATLPVGLSEPEYMQIGITMLMCAEGINCAAQLCALSHCIYFNQGIDRLILTPLHHMA